MIKAISFEGGGTCGIAYAGAIAALAKHVDLNQVESYAGTSAGAMTAMIMAAGYQPAELLAIARNTRYSALARVSPMGILTRRGLYSGAPLLALARRHIRDRLGRDITFRGLLQATGRSLRVLAVDETAMTLHEFSPETTPDVIVSLAVTASASIPGVFPAVEIDGHLFSDGGLIANDPIDVHSTRPVDQVLGFRVDHPSEIFGEPPQVTRWFVGRVWRLMSLARKTANLRHVPKELYAREIVIDIGDLSGVNFRVDRETREHLIHRGAVAVDRQIGALLGPAS